MRTLRRLTVTLGLFAALGASTVAAAKDKKAEKADEGEKKADKGGKPDDKPGGAKGIGEYEKLLLEAHKAFAAGLAGGALDEAIVGYRKAIGAEPTRPEAHLFLAGALYQKGDHAAADEALGQAVNRAKADKTFANVLGKAMFLTATNLEAMGGKGAEALAAWKAYGEFAKDNPDAQSPEGAGATPPWLLKVHPGSAIEREAKLESYAKSINEYAKVKEAIFKRQKELGIDPNVKPVTAADKK